MRALTNARQTGNFILLASLACLIWLKPASSQSSANKPHPACDGVWVATQSGGYCSVKHNTEGAEQQRKPSISPSSSTTIHYGVEERPTPNLPRREPAPVAPRIPMQSGSLPTASVLTPQPHVPRKPNVPQLPQRPASRPNAIVPSLSIVPGGAATSMTPPLPGSSSTQILQNTIQSDSADSSLPPGADQSAVDAILTGAAEGVSGQTDPNNPNAIVDTANQQASQMLAIGAANDAARRQAAQAKLAVQQGSQGGGATLPSGYTPGPITIVLTHSTNWAQGSAHVVSTPAGIDCPPACSASFPKGTNVDLEAAADSNSIVRSAECWAQTGGGTAPRTPGNSMGCEWPGIYADRGGRAIFVVDAANSGQQQVITGNGRPVPPGSTNCGSAATGYIPCPGAGGGSGTNNQNTGAPAPNFCSPVASPRQPPVHTDSIWGQWMFLGNTGVAISVSRVDSKTLTWEFFNGRSDSITSLNFNYTYADADSGQNTTQKDVVPLTLKPGDGLGGWTAYTANTRGNVSIAITSMTCQ